MAIIPTTMPIIPKTIATYAIVDIPDRVATSADRLSTFDFKVPISPEVAVSLFSKLFILLSSVVTLLSRLDIFVSSAEIFF